MSERQFPVRTILFISVALNVLLLGAIGGAYFSGARLQRQPEEQQQAVVDRLPGPRAFIRALPPVQRASMRERMRSTWTETRALREEARAAREAAFEAASQEPFDAERVRAAFARLRAADQAAIGGFHDTLIEAFAQMTPQERATALEALRRAPPARRDNVRPAAGAPGAELGAEPGAGLRGEGLRQRPPPCEGTPAEIRQCRQERREQFRQRRRESLQDESAPAQPQP